MAWEPDYITLTEFKEWAGVTTTSDDVAISKAITASSRAVDRFCSQNVFRQFGQMDAPVEFFYTPRWDSKMLKWVIEIDDLMTTLGMVIEVDTANSGVYSSAITDFVLRPRDALAKNRPYTQIAIGNTSSIQPVNFPDSARVLARWGWTTYPPTIVEATYLQTNRTNKRRTAVFQSSGNTQRGTQVSVNLIDELDPDIETMLQTYVKRGWTI